MNTRSANYIRGSEMEGFQSQETGLTHHNVGIVDRNRQPRKAATSQSRLRAPMPVKVADLNSMVIIRKKAPPRTYKERLAHKAEKQRLLYKEKLEKQEPAHKSNKILDGFLLLHSCKVKLPHEAESSKLSGQAINDVRMEDLVYFKNLKAIDLSDNQLQLDWLRNLENCEEIDLQYN